MAKKKAATRAERQHMSRVAELGCIVCANIGFPGSPAEFHHINNGTMGKRASNREGIPLCPSHHRTGGYGVAVHAGRKEWESRYGTERELLDQVISLV